LVNSTDTVKVSQAQEQVSWPAIGIIEKKVEQTDLSGNTGANCDI
jgi:hypothetical protein